MTAGEKEALSAVMKNSASRVFVIDQRDDAKTQRMYMEKFKSGFVQELAKKNSIYVIFSPVSSYKKK